MTPIVSLIIIICVCVAIGSLAMRLAEIGESFVDDGEASPKIAAKRPPICLDCIEYGAPYDGPCELCGRHTRYVRGVK